MSEGHDHRKHPRQRVLKEGKLVSYDMTSSINVTVRDLSEKGARVETSAPIHLPDRFSLVIVSEKMIYPAVARWQRGNFIGIEFIGGPRPAGLRASKVRVP